MSSITPRDPILDLSGVPRHWVGGHAAATGLANAVSMLFPAGERFFVRSVHAFRSAWADDPELAARVRGFSGQEGRHARLHDEFNAVLRAQGYRIDRFLDWYDADQRKWEARLSPALRLAVTAALEHFTAIMAENALTGRDHLFANGDPRMVAFLGWHAVEEIEHRSVAFDVLQRVDPSYRTRALGISIGTVLFARYWAAGARMLWRQDGLTVRQALRSLRELATGGGPVRNVFAPGIRAYLRRDFHPDANPIDDLARDWLAGHPELFEAAA